MHVQQLQWGRYHECQCQKLYILHVHNSSLLFLFFPFAQAGTSHVGLVQQIRPVPKHGEVTQIIGIVCCASHSCRKLRSDHSEVAFWKHTSYLCKVLELTARRANIPPWTNYFRYGPNISEISGPCGSGTIYFLSLRVKCKCA